MFEYRVIPAPTRGKKAKGLKTPADRFANALSEVINDMARDGWQYLRAETLPQEERSGLSGKRTTYQNMLVFGRMTDIDIVEDHAAADDSTTPAEALAVVAQDMPDPHDDTPEHHVEPESYYEPAQPEDTPHRD